MYIFNDILQVFFVSFLKRRINCAFSFPRTEKWARPPISRGGDELIGRRERTSSATWHALTTLTHIPTRTCTHICIHAHIHDNEDKRHTGAVQPKQSKVLEWRAVRRIDFECRFETFHVTLLWSWWNSQPMTLYGQKYTCIHMYIYVCLLKWKQCLNCTNSNKCISWWELDAKGTVQLFWQAGLLPWSHGQLGHKKNHNVSVCARLLQWNTGVIFLLSDTNHLLHFTVFLLRTYVYFVTFVCIEAVWVETDLDGGNKGALSLDNLVLLLEKGLKVTGVSDTVHDFNCLCTNTKGTCPVFH